jgi:tetratricopeptide (TPR) repeat protein
MPSEREYEEVLQQDPGHNEAFLFLRRKYRESGRYDKLVTLYETRAQAIADESKAAELFYLAAEVRVDQLADVAGAEADLAHAISRDATHRKAAKRLKDIYREQGRGAEYYNMLEVEAAAVGRSGDAARVDELRAEIHRTYGAHITRVETALSTPGRRAEITPEQLLMVESARKVLNALGDYATVCRLYEIELTATSDPKRRISLMFRLGRVLAEKVGDLPRAAQKLADVVRLYPRDDKALEALAAVYANPNWVGGDGQERAAGLYNQIARRRYEVGDTDHAVASLRKALAAVPSNPEAQTLLERVLSEAGRFTELDRFLRERITAAQTIPEQIALLTKRAHLAESSLSDIDEAIRTYELVSALESPDGSAGQHLAKLYAGRQEYAKLAELRKRQLERTTEPAIRLFLQRELAVLYRDKLGDREQAAIYLHAILQADPGDAEAFKGYADHFRQRGSFRELADLLSFVLEHERTLGKPASEILPRLEELAVLVESKLSDMDRALGVWRQMVELDPSYERAREAQKRILQKTKQWDQMVPLFIEDVDRATDPDQKVESLRRLARLYFERLENADAASSVYMQILTLDPHDATALRAVMESYEKKENWTALAELLRAQVEGASSEAEKVAFLRRLLVLYEKKLADPTSESWAANQILRFVPGDREALVHLEAVYEKSNDKPRLVKTLEYHLRFSPSEEEHLRIVRRIAELLQEELQDFTKAIPYWEMLLQLVPGDERAIEALLTAYDSVKRPEELVRILDLKVKFNSTNRVVQAEALRRLARLAASALKQTNKAEGAWMDLLALYPEDREALEELSAIVAEKRDFSYLVQLLDRRVQGASSPTEAISLALQRAQVFEEELHSLDETITVLEQILASLDPNHWITLTSLRRVAEANGDWPRVVHVAERLLDLTSEPALKIERGLELGRLCQTRLADTVKAIAVYERVLGIDPTQVEALTALSAIYKDANDGESYLSVQERLLALTQTPSLRRELLFRMAEAALDLLGAPSRAFEWYRKAYNELPDDLALGKLEQTAEKHHLWNDLIRVYLETDSRITQPREHLDYARKVANLYEKNLMEPESAFATLRAALVHEPSGTTLLPELERLARLQGNFQGLIGVYNQLSLSRTSVEERIGLVRLCAKVREEDMHDASGAMDENLRAFSLDPDSQTNQQEILRLAELSGRWEDVLQMEGKLFTRATSVPIKIEIARRAAALVEEKLQDDVRAFRTYLNAFRLSPDDEDLITHLWRLANKIGRYKVEVGDRPLSTVAVSPPSIQEITAEYDLDEEGSIVETLALTPSPQTVSQEAATPTVELDPLEVTGEIDVLDVDILEEAPLPSPVLPPRRIPSPRVIPMFETPWQEWVHAYEGLSADHVTRHRYLLKQAAIWERGAKNWDRALERLERAFILNPKDEMVCGEMERLAGEYDRWNTVCNVYQRAADRGQREESMLLNLRVGRIREEQSGLEQAEARYRAVLVLDPSNTKALDRLEAIYRTLSRWSDLATVLERRTMSGEAQLKGTEMRQRAYELADLYESKLERPYEAVGTLERYVASIEEERLLDEGKEDNSALVEEARTGYQALARLLGKVGMAQKAAAALQRALELADEGPEAHAGRIRLATLFEQELGLPAKAIEVYETILQKTPLDLDAITALDRLLLATGQFERLATLIEHRITIALGAERSELIWRRARILEEKLGNPDAAAMCLRQLGPEALTDEGMVNALLRNLRGAKLYSEALNVLDHRILHLKKAQEDSREISALYLQKAQLIADDLNDISGAVVAVEAALRESPSDVDTLTALARFQLKRNDFQAYAEVLLRKADLLPGIPEQVSVLLEAAAVYRDQLGNQLQARACYERAVKDHPANEDALGALASLEAAEGRLEEARCLYERQLDVTDAPAGKAAVLTRLARVLCENPELLFEAEARLDQALEIEPGYLPAVITMADIHYREQQWTKAERRLNEALRRLRGQPDQTARLYHRLGEVYEKLGRLEEGYRQLLEADRAMPGQLLLRIALVENRFQARHWREAAMHVEGIAEHPMASQYSEEVAQALTHGALAELRLKRPERSAALNEQALRLSPSHPRTLRALADLAIERGDKLEATQSLRRVAECSASQSERIQIFEQIGNLHLALENPTAARMAFGEAVSLLEQNSEAYIPLLEKLLGLERADGEIRQAIQTARRIAECVADPKERATRRREVAVLQLEQGEPLAAAETLEKVLEDEPSDEMALHQLCDAYARAGRSSDVAKTLERLLPTLPTPVESKIARERSALWERLGAAVALRDVGEGIHALEKAVAADPSRVSARLALARLYEQNPEREALALLNHQAILRLEPASERSLRALATEHLQQSQWDPAHCHLELLSLLGLAQEEDRAVLGRTPALHRGTDEPFAGIIDDTLRATHLVHPNVGALGEIFAILWEALPLISHISLDTLGVTTKDKVSAISDLDVAKIFSQVGKALCNQRAGLYLKTEGEINELRLLPTPPMGIVVGEQLTATASVAELRFRIARALEFLRPEHVLAVSLDPMALDDLFMTVLKAFHPKHNRWRAGSEDSVAEEAAKLKKALPYKFAKRIAEIFQERADEELDCIRWRGAVFETGNRAGLLVCGDLAYAARIVLSETLLPPPPWIGADHFLENAQKEGLFKELLRFFISPDHFKLRKVLGISVGAVEP